MMLSPDSRQCVSIQPRVLFLSMSQQWVSEWVSEWVNQCCQVCENSSTQRERKREKNKFGNGSADWESKESWISVTHYQDWNLDTAKINDQLNNCPIWIQIGFVLFWDSSQVYDYSSTVVIVFVCVWMCVSYLCKFSWGRDWKRSSKVCMCVREREPMSYFVPPCNYSMVEYDLSRWGQCHQAQLSFPGAPSSQYKHLSLTWWAFSTFECTYLFSNTHSDF